MCRLALPQNISKGEYQINEFTDFKLAQQFLEAAIALGAQHPTTALIRSECCHHGWLGYPAEGLLGVQRLFFLREGAQKGSVRAQIILGGILLEKPQRTPAEEAEGRRWMRRAVLNNPQPDPVKTTVSEVFPQLVSLIVLYHFYVGL